MLAKFDGLDYHIFLSHPTRELDRLKESLLESHLMNFQESEYLGRTVVLQMGQNKNPEGAELSLDDCNNVLVTINPYAYETLKSTRKLFTTYLKTENKLRIQVRPF